MDLLMVAAAVLGYLVFVVFVLALLTAAKRVDEASEREHRARMRSTRKALVPRRSATDDHDSEISVRRLVG